MEQLVANVCEALYAQLHPNPSNPQGIHNAVTYLNTLRSEDEFGFMKLLANIFKTESIHIGIRSSALTSLKNCLKSNNEEEQQSIYDRWNSYDADARTDIKNTIINALGIPDLAKPAAQGISAMLVAEATPEAPLNPEFLDYLVSNCENADVPIELKSSCLETLGYLCEELSEAGKSNCIASASVNRILTIVVGGVVELERKDYREKSIRALSNMVDFIDDNMHTEAERTQITNAVAYCAQLDDHLDSKILAYETMVSLVKQYYDVSSTFIETFYNLSLSALSNPEEQIGLKGLDFWTTICEVESQIAAELEDEPDNPTPPILYNYAKGALATIFPIVLRKLCEQEDDNINSDEYNIHSAAAICVESYALCERDAVIPYVVMFIEQNAQSQNWQEREAAIIAFGSIIEGPSTSKLQEYVDTIIPLLTHSCSPMEQSVGVKDSALWVIGHIAEIFPDNIINSPDRETILDNLMAALNDSESEIINHACFALNTIHEAAYDAADLTEEDPETYCLSSRHSYIVTKLLEICFTPTDNTKLRNSAFECLGEFASSSPNDCVPTVSQLGVALLMRLRERLESIGQLLGADDKNEFSEMIALICHTLGSVLHRLPSNDVQVLGASIFPLALEMIKNIPDIRDDAMMLLIALIQNLGENFPAEYLQQLHQPLINVMNDYTDFQGCKFAVSMIGDICRSVSSQALPYINDWMTVFQYLLQLQDVHYSVKPAVFVTFGDIAIAIGSEFTNYLPLAMNYLLPAAAYRIENIHDFNQLQVGGDVYEGVVEALTGIIQGLRGIEKQPNPALQAMQPYLTEILDFLKRLADPKIKDVLTESLQRSTCGLIGDMYHALKAFGATHLLTQGNNNILQLVKNAQKSGNEKTKDIAKWTYQSLISK